VRRMSGLGRLGQIATDDVTGVRGL
jgi:hypothetical protein